MLAVVCRPPAKRRKTQVDFVRILIINFYHDFFQLSKNLSKMQTILRIFLEKT